MSQSSSDPLSSPPGSQRPIELRLLLICHAEEMQNRYANLAGTDSGLTALGWQQADLLAQWLATHYQVDTLIAAPQLRNRLTAQRVGQTIGLPVSVQQKVSGTLSPSRATKNKPTDATAEDVGQPGDEATAPSSTTQISETTRISKTPRSSKNADTEAVFCDGQIGEFLQQLVKKHSGSTVALVVSGNLIAAMLASVFQATHLHTLLTHTGVTEVQLRGGQWALAYMNRHEHLPEPPNPKIERRQEAVDEPVIPEALSLLSRVYGRNAAELLDNQDAARQQRIDDLIEFADLTPGMKVVDIGGGAGLLALSLAKTVDVAVMSVDISPAMLERAEFFRLNAQPDIARTVDFRLAAAQRLPFRNDRFDAAFCRMMLHLNRQPQRILQEAWRVLKPGGVLIVGELLGVADPVKRATQNAIEERRNPSHISAYSDTQYVEFIESAGFTIETQKEATFIRRLDTWLAELGPDPADAATVREMVEASLETDAAGINAKRQGDDIFFSQRFLYVRAIKPSET